MKYNGIFTTAATKALKKANGIWCQYDEEARRIYVLAGGCLAMVMTPEDYDAIARPATGRDPGNWIWRDGQLQPLTTDIKAVVDKNVAPVQAADGTLAAVMPGRYSSGKLTVMACYAPDRDTVATADESLLAAFDFGLTRPHVAASNQGIVMVAGDNVVVGLVCPVKLDAKIARSVRAYFREDDGAGSAGVDNDRADRLQRSVDRLRDDLADKNREIDSLKAELEKLQAAADAPKTAGDDAAKKDGSAADRAGEVAGRLCELDGLQVVVNGATTATPVVWISGDVNAHADAIRAEGGKYSVKKGAYYIKIV